ncbi:hypothetical protein [Nonomuraea sp. NPDC003754]
MPRVLAAIGPEPLGELLTEIALEQWPAAAIGDVLPALHVLDPDEADEPHVAIALDRVGSWPGLLSLSSRELVDQPFVKARPVLTSLFSAVFVRLTPGEEAVSHPEAAASLPPEPDVLDTPAERDILDTFAEPDTARSDTAQPNVAQPELSQPAPAQPTPARPEAPERDAADVLESAAPGRGAAGVARLEALAPDALEPETSAPDHLEPKTSTPDALEPEAAAAAPDASGPNASPDALGPDALGPDPSGHGLQASGADSPVEFGMPAPSAVSPVEPASPSAVSPAESVTPSAVSPAEPVSPSAGAPVAPDRPVAGSRAEAPPLPSRKPRSTKQSYGTPFDAFGTGTTTGGQDAAPPAAPEQAASARAERWDAFQASTPRPADSGQDSAFKPVSEEPPAPGVPEASRLQEAAGAGALWADGVQEPAADVLDGTGAASPGVERAERAGDRADEAAPDGERPHPVGDPVADPVGEWSFAAVPDDEPAAGVPDGDLPASRVPSDDLPAARVQGDDLPAARVPGDDLSAAGIQGDDLPAARVQGDDLPAAGVPGDDLPAARVQDGDLFGSDTPDGLPVTGASGGELPEAGVPGGDLPHADVPHDRPADAGAAHGDLPDAGVPGDDLPDAGDASGEPADAGFASGGLPEAGLSGGEPSAAGAPAGAVDLHALIEASFAGLDDKTWAVAQNRVFTDAPSAVEQLAKLFAAPKAEIVAVEAELRQRLLRWLAAEETAPYRAHLDDLRARLGVDPPRDLLIGAADWHGREVRALDVPAWQFVQATLAAPARIAEVPGSPAVPEPQFLGPAEEPQFSGPVVAGEPPFPGPGVGEPYLPGPGVGEPHLPGPGAGEPHLQRPQEPAAAPVLEPRFQSVPGVEPYAGSVQAPPHPEPQGAPGEAAARFEDFPAPAPSDGNGNGKPHQAFKDVSLTKRCFRQPDGRWWLRIDVTAEQLATGECALPSGFAAYLGLTAGASWTVRSAAGELSISWLGRPCISQMGRLLADVGAREGGHLFITLSKEGVLRAKHLPVATPGASKISKALRLADYTGLSSAIEHAARIIAIRIGMSGNVSLDDLKTRLRERGDRDLLDLLD